MTEGEAELTLEPGHEKFPQTLPHIIYNNGPQFITRDFKEF